LTRAAKVVQGRLRQRSFETRDGDKRTVVELEVDEIGPSLRYATFPRGFAKSEGSSGGNSRAEDVR
jgi:single-strand DNA-binding protein